MAKIIIPPCHQCGYEYVCKDGHLLKDGNSAKETKKHPLGQRRS